MRYCIALFAALTVTAISVPGWSGEHDALFARLDADHNGQMDRGEIAAEHLRLFERLLRQGDHNGDRKLTLEEFTRGLKPPDPPAAMGAPFAGGPGAMPGGFDPARLFIQLDRNGDGRLDRDEAPERLKQNFDRADADQDGSIDRREFLRGLARPRPGGDRNAEGAKKEDAPTDAPGAAPGGMTAQFLTRLDRNQDGQLSRQEAPPQIQRAFDNLDSDGDGQLNAAELRAAQLRRLQGND